MSWTPEDRSRLAEIATKAHCGYLDGHRDMQLSTQYETAEWRARAVEHDAARRRLNGLLPATEIMRRCREGATFLGDHTRFDGPAVQAAMADFRRCCAGALTAPNPKPRRILTMIRLAAELAGAPDPVWSASDWGQPVSHADFAFNRLFRQTERALKAGGMA